MSEKPKRARARSSGRSSARDVPTASRDDQLLELLERRAEELDAERRQVSQEADRLRDEIAELQYDRLKIERELGRLGGELKATEAESEVRTIRVAAQLEGELKANQAESEARARRVAELEGELKANQAESEARARRVAELEGELKAARAVSEARARTVAELERELNASRAECEAGSRRVAELERELNTSRAESNQLKGELQRVRSSQAFRMGHAAVRLLLAPITLIKAVWRGVRSIVNRSPALDLPVAATEERESEGTRKASRAEPEAQARRATVSMSKSAANGQGGGTPSRTTTPDSKRDDNDPSAPALPLPAGNALEGMLSKDSSNVLVLAWDLEEGQLEKLVDSVLRLQLIRRDFRPLFVTDTTALHQFRKHGFAYEYIPPADEWGRHNHPLEHEWVEFVEQRMESILGSYNLDVIMVFDDPADSTTLREGIVGGLVSPAAQRRRTPR